MTELRMIFPTPSIFKRLFCFPAVVLETTGTIIQNSRYAIHITASDPAPVFRLF